MRLKAVKKLVDINILYAIQPAQLQQYRKRQAKNPKNKINVSLQAIRTYVILGIIYLFLFSLMGAANQMVDNPGLFANLVSVFALFSMSQGFLVFYNVFYESKDLQSYRPYAFSEAEIIIGKSVSVLLTLLIAILPMFSYFFVLAFQGGNPLLGLPAAFISIVVLSFILTFLTLILVHFITKTAFFRKYKNLLSNIILAVVSLGSMILYIVINQLNNRSLVNQIKIQSFFPPVESFHRFILHPFDSSALVGMAAWLVFAALLFLLVKFKVVPEFYEAAMMTSSTVSRRERVRDINLDEAKNFTKFVWRYHLRLLSEGSVIMQTVLMSAVLPYIFLFSFAMAFMSRGQSISAYLTPQYLLPMIVVAMLIATLNSGGNNLTAVGISLERENFNYLKVLPFDLKRYIRLKFWYLFAIQSLLPLALFLGLAVLIGLHPISLLALLLVWFLTSLLWSSWGYHRDYKHLVTNWSNVTELMTRDNSMVKTLLAIGLILGSLLAIGALFALATFLPVALSYTISGLVILTLALLAYLGFRHYMKKLTAEIARFS